jgi:Icc-related predicted phosphoesterase
MLLVSDVHGAFDALGRIATGSEPLLILGDFINFVDYRTNDGILADVLGYDFVKEVSKLRAMGDYAGSRRLWKERFGGGDTIRNQIRHAVKRQYDALTDVLAGSGAYVTYGNVDWPGILRESLPPGVRFVDGGVVEIEGLAVGIVGGGAPTPLAVPGEVSEVELAEKLRNLGQVDVLCTHLAPAVPALRRDVITGREEGGSEAVLEYLVRERPGFHYFGDIHQPQASRWRVGPTRCVNVGYFRATHRAIRHVGEASYARTNRERK